MVYLERTFDMDLNMPAMEIAAILGSFVICLLILLTKRKHIKVTAQGHAGTAVQSSHADPTPRIGGAGILIGMAIVAGFFVLYYHTITAGAFFLSIIPVFVAGALEDLGRAVSPRARLFAAAFSAGLAVVIMDAWMPRVDIPYLDSLFAFAPLAIAFTIFASTGVCHSINVIDGVNGLSSSVALAATIGLALISLRAGDQLIYVLSVLTACVVLGFLFFNFPFGNLFLGDGGAYTLGHLLAWYSIGLIMRNDQVSTWSVLLILFWPIMEVLYSIYRRRKIKSAIYQPDRAHVHQIIMHLLRERWLPVRWARAANPLTTVVLLPLIAMPVIVAVQFWRSPLLGFIGVVVFFALYVFLYGRLARAGAGGKTITP